MSNNEIEVLFRSFNTSKGFRQDATHQAAPELIKSQKALATAKAVADKSEADPLYQQARAERGGYDTCVTDRVAKPGAQKKITSATTTTHTEQHKQALRQIHVEPDWWHPLRGGVEYREQPGQDVGHRDLPDRQAVALHPS
ncbi:hypothetical protein [Streptomyces sp. NPDC056061]|uniref:hypothetical protein n=1 Tax=Streptomyces sp. NPDC056061 TaxID=3345700 RepID=UPI0035D95014